MIRKIVAVINNPTVATISLLIKERMIGRIIKIPEIWRTNPMFARSALIYPWNRTIPFIISYTKNLFKVLTVYFEFSFRVSLYFFAMKTLNITSYLRVMIYSFFRSIRIDRRNGMSTKMLPRRIRNPIKSSPSNEEEPVEKPLTYQSIKKNIATVSGTMSSTGANKSSRRSRSFWIFSFTFVFFPFIQRDRPIIRGERWFVVVKYWYSSVKAAARQGKVLSLGGFGSWNHHQETKVSLLHQWQRYLHQQNQQVQGPTSQLGAMWGRRKTQRRRTL